MVWLASFDVLLLAVFLLFMTTFRCCPFQLRLHLHSFSMRHHEAALALPPLAEAHLARPAANKSKLSVTECTGFLSSYVHHPPSAQPFAFSEFSSAILSQSALPRRGLATDSNSALRSQRALDLQARRILYYLAFDVPNFAGAATHFLLAAVACGRLSAFVLPVA